MEKFMKAKTFELALQMELGELNQSKSTLRVSHISINFYIKVVYIESDLVSIK